MSTYRNEQRRVSHRGREFHFVSYAERPANPRLNEPAQPAMWYLMTAGKRWPVVPQVLGQDPDELDSVLRRWVEANVFPPADGVSRRIRAS